MSNQKHTANTTHQLKKRTEEEVRSFGHTCKTPTTSLTIIKIQTIAIPNPRKHKLTLPGCLGL